MTEVPRRRVPRLALGLGAGLGLFALALWLRVDVIVGLVEEGVSFVEGL